MELVRIDVEVVRADGKDPLESVPIIVSIKLNGTEGETWEYTSAASELDVLTGDRLRLRLEIPVGVPSEGTVKSTLLSPVGT